MITASTSPRPHASRRSAARWTGLLAAVLIVLPGVPAAAESPPAESQDVTLSVAAGSDGILSDGQNLLVTVAADNPSAAGAVGGSVAVSLGHTPITSPGDLSAWIAGGAAPPPDMQPIGTTDFDVVPPLGTRAASIVAPPEQTGGDDLAPGVYPLEAALTAPDGTTVTATSVMVVAPDAPSGQVAVVVPITAPAIQTGLLTADELADLTTPAGALRGQLDAVRGTGAILAVDPAIVAAIRVLGTAAPASAIAWLDELMALPNERFALQFGDADLAAQVAAGRTQPLTVDTLAPYLDSDGAATPAATPSASPSASPTPAAPESPSPTPTAPATTGTDTASLLDIGSTVGTVYWPATGTADATTVAALSALPAPEGGPARILLPTASAPQATTAHAGTGAADLLVYDADVSTQLRTASTTTEVTERGAALAAASGYSALAAAADPDGTLLVTVDRAASRPAVALRATVVAAGRLSGRAPADVAALTALPRQATTVAGADQEPAVVAAIDEFERGEADIAAFATVLDDPTLLTAPERATVLQLLGNAWRDTRDDWNTAVADHRAATRTTLASVAIVPPSDLTLLGSSAPLRFTVRNDLPWPASVVLLARPDDPRLVVQHATAVSAGPRQNTRVEVPVQARVARGEASVALELQSPTGIDIGDDLDVAIAVRAEWESVGIVAMAVLVGGLLVAGGIRTAGRIRRRRQASTTNEKDGRSDG